VFDEQLVGYQPSPQVKKRAEQQGYPIPVVYIPRKPNPNGLLMYLVGVIFLELIINIIVGCHSCASS